MQGSVSCDLYSGDPHDRYLALRKLTFPLSTLSITWAALTIAIYFVAVHTDVLLHYFLLFGSLLSLVAGACIMFAGCMASTKHRKTFFLIYSLTMCYTIFAVKLFLTAIMAVTGHDLAWQEKHTSWCYTMALWGQIFFMTSLGYTVVIILNILLILERPMFYNRNKSNIRACYHLVVWILALFSCIPAVAADAVGVNEHGTCWFTGDYIWSAGAFDVLFNVFVLVSIAYLFNAMVRDDGNATHATAASVLHQSVLIAIGFVFSYLWNWVFRSRLLLNQSVPHWLNAVQIFWLGSVGFNNALIWIPFIRKAFRSARRVTVFNGRRPSSSSLYVSATFEITAANKYLSRSFSVNGTRNGQQLDGAQLEVLQDIASKKEFEIV